MDHGIYFDGRHYDALWPGLHRQNELAFYKRLVGAYGDYDGTLFTAQSSRQLIVCTLK